MDKKSVKTIINVVLGISLIMMLTAYIGMVYSCISMADVFKMAGVKPTDTDDPTLWMLIALCCVFVPAFVSYAFAYFGNKKIFTTAAAVLSLFITATIIAFVAVLRNRSLEDPYSYTTIASLNAELLELLLTVIIADAYFIYNSVKSFLIKPVQPAEETVTEDACNEEA